MKWQWSPPITLWRVRPHNPSTKVSRARLLQGSAMKLLKVSQRVRVLLQNAYLFNSSPCLGTGHEPLLVRLNSLCLPGLGGYAVFLAVHEISLPRASVLSHMVSYTHHYIVEYWFMAPHLTSHVPQSSFCLILWNGLVDINDTSVTANWIVRVIMSELISVVLQGLEELRSYSCFNVRPKAG